MSAAPAVAKPGPPPHLTLAMDSSVIVAFLLQETTWKSVHRVLEMPHVSTVLPGPALAESINVARRKGNQSSGEQIYAALTALGVRVEHPTDDDLVRAAELLEISRDNPGPPHPLTDQQGTLSLGDALILATVERLECKVLTRDDYWSWMVEQSLLDVQVIVP